MYNDKPNNETHLCLLPNQQYKQVHVGQPSSPFLRVFLERQQFQDTTYHLNILPQNTILVYVYATCESTASQNKFQTIL